MACKSWVAILVVMLGFVPYSIDILLSEAKHVIFNQATVTKELIYVLHDGTVLCVNSEEVMLESCRVYLANIIYAHSLFIPI